MKTVVKPEAEPTDGESGFACLQLDEEQKEWVALSLGSLKKATPKPSYGEAIFSCPEMGWRFEAKSMAGKILEGRVLWPETKEGRPRRKLFWEEMSKKYKGFTSVLTFVDTGAGTRELREIMGETTLQFPKPHALIKELIRQCTDEEDIILDSFAGSGTTGHAVLSLNSEDEESNRRFILVQQKFDSNEDRSNQVNICQAVTATRLRKVINGYKFEGDKSQIVLEEKLTLSALKKADKILEDIEEAKRLALPKYDDVKVKCENGSVTVTGTKSITSKVDGIGGSFVYARLSEKPILGEYRDITKNPPSYEEIAKYVYYTEASAVWDKKGLINKTGKIGEHRNTSLYLLYTPNQKDDQALDVTFLNTIVAKDKNPTIVIYCEKIWIHRSELLEWSAKHKKTIRPMIVPFNLK